MKGVLERQGPVSIATAMDLHRQNRLDEALRMYRKLLKRDRNCLDALHLSGVILCDKGALTEARKSIRKAVRLNAEFYFAWNSLGNVERAMGHYEEAAHCYERALTLSPDYELAADNLFSVLLESEQWDRVHSMLAVSGGSLDQWFRLGLEYTKKGVVDKAEQAFTCVLQRQADHQNALFALSTIQCQQNRFDEALPQLEYLLQLNPTHGDALFNLSLVWQGLGDVGNCRQYLERLLQAHPSYVHGWYNYGRLLGEQEEFEASQRAFSECIALQGDYIDAIYNRGSTYQALGRSEEAIADFERVLALDDSYVKAYYNWAYECFTLGQFEDSAALFLRALAIQPDYIDAHYNLGNVYYAQSEYVLAIRSFAEVVVLDPNYAKAWYNQGKCFLEIMDLEQAEQSLLKALELGVNVGDTWTNLALGYVMSGRLDSAENAYRKSAELKGDAATYSNLLFFLTYYKNLSSADLLREHRQFEKRFASGSDSWELRQQAWSAKSRLRVGYVSGDFCSHVVNSFFEGLIASHHRDRVETFAYANVDKEDKVTRRLREQFDHWRPIAKVDDDEVRQQIREDGIDVLVDLSGHSAKNRLSLFLDRLAPVQVEYLGYIATTGLSTMDYRISDPFLNPSEGEDTSEEIYRLPRCYKAYTPFVGYPDVAMRSPKAGEVVFGSLNRISKMSRETFALWSAVLRAVPRSSLVLYRMELRDASTRQKILDTFAELGVAADRIDMFTEMKKTHLEGYDLFDIALDPCPVVGGATTAEALWQGVPVLTLAGDAHRSCISASLLAAVGLEDWIARSPEEFVAKAVEKAENPEALIALRSQQRQMMEDSPLRDFDGLATALEDAYFDMWDRLKS